MLEEVSPINSNPDSFFSHSRKRHLGVAHVPKMARTSLPSNVLFQNVTLLFPHQVVD